MKAARYRFPILLLAMAALLAALWAGGLRLGWHWPVLQPDLPGSHGALMVSGFLGTLVALERAVALGRPWMYTAPLFSGLGGILLILGVLNPIGPILLLLGSLLLSAMMVIILRRHAVTYTIVMACGVFCWSLGNLLWLTGWSIPRVVLWWASFLILTIAGERLELGRLARIPPWAPVAFNLICGLFLTGVAVSLINLSLSTRLAGVAMLGLSAWLLRFDIARRTIRQVGLPRYAAVCLLTGYVWLGLGGVLAVSFGAMAAGVYYDAYLHTIFVGFVISMIFGHAPIIFPSVLQLPITYKPVFYVPLALLHISLLARILGDLLQAQTIRLWGGLFNGIAILLFLVITAGVILHSRLQKPLGQTT